MTVLTPLPGADLVAQLDASRARLDRATQLMEWSMNIREMLAWGLDLDDMRVEIDDFTRAVEQHKRQLPVRRAA